MNCEDAAELIGAYAIDALDADEAAAVRAHLESCAEHRALAAELRAIALEFPSLAEPIDAPPALRARVLDAVARQSQDRPGVQPISIGSARERRGSQRFLRISPPMWGAIAAALVLAVAGLAGWNIALQNRLSGRDDAAHFATRVTWTAPLNATGAQESHGTVVYFGDQNKAVVFGDGLPPLDASKTYQLWSVGEAPTPQSLGFMQVAADGHGTTIVRYNATDATTLAITVEPAGGSDAPTSNPVYTAKA